MNRSRYLPAHVRRQVRQSLIYLCLILGLLAICVGVYRGGVHLVELEADAITINELPSALFLSFTRIAIAYAVSLVFSYLIGLVAAKTKMGERILIPLLDVLQSIPIVGFFPAAITFFIAITDGHRMGVEIAAVFLIFTSQAWNMAFAVYEAVKGIPQDSLDAVESLGVKGSKRLWLLYAPACVPRLVYNSILSWSNGWFFLVACEIIAEGPIRYHLPGIGSFLARAAEQDKIHLVVQGLLALTLLIVLMDFFIWRPISIWSEKFKQEDSTDDFVPTLFALLPKKFLDFLSPAFGPTKVVLRSLAYPFTWLFTRILVPIFWDLPYSIATALSQDFYKKIAEPTYETLSSQPKRWPIRLIGTITVLSLISIFSWILWGWLRPPWPEIASKIPLAILVSTGRLTIALFISFAWILPVVLYCWNRPKLRQMLNTTAQVFASLPAPALFPLIFVVTVQKFGGDMELASILLLLTGMQWYLLFNCIGGTAAIPNNLKEAAASYGLTRMQTWKKLVLPAMRPAMITGALTAWGGGWNALVVAEYVMFKDQVLSVHGIGSLLCHAVYDLGDNRAIMLCIGGMVGWIILLNTLFWRPVYQFALERFKFDT